MPAAKYVSIYSAIVGTTALAFQVKVLYPWHHEISSQIDSLENRLRKMSGEPVVMKPDTHDHSALSAMKLLFQSPIQK